MDLEGLMLSEVSQREKDKWHMMSLIYGFFKKKKKAIDRTNWWLQKVGGGVGEMCKLFFSLNKLNFKQFLNPNTNFSNIQHVPVVQLSRYSHKSNSHFILPKDH